MKANSKRIRSQVWQPASAGKGVDMSELQAHHCMQGRIRPVRLGGCDFS